MGAKYLTLAPLFIAPYHVPKGAKIETDSPPNDSLHPLNAEAEAAMEAWYNEEWPELDPKTKAPILRADGTPATFKPHIKFKPMGASAPAGEAPTVRMIEAPRPDDLSGTLDLATARYAPGSNGELRPAPDPVFAQAAAGEDGSIIELPPTSTAKGPR